MIQTSTERNKVLCLGRTYCDIIFTGLHDMPVLGRERFAKDVAITVGGGAYITAAHLVSLGRPAALLTRLGTDPLSCGLNPELDASGVDLSFVERSGDAGPQPTVALVKDGERAFVSRRAGSSRPATLEQALTARDVAHLHIAEFATLNDNPDVIAMARPRPDGLARSELGRPVDPPGHQLLRNLRGNRCFSAECGRRQGPNGQRFAGRYSAPTEGAVSDRSIEARRAWRNGLERADLCLGRGVCG